MRLMIRYMPRPSTGRHSRNTSEISASMVSAITMEKISVMGERTAMRMIIWKAFCTLVTSVVRRVMIEEVLNLSILEKE